MNVTLAGHLWEALEFLKMSFDEDKDGGLAGEGGQPNRQGLETEQDSGRRGELRVWQDLRERPARVQMRAVTSVVFLQETLLFPPENLRAEQAQSHPDIPTDMN